MGAAVSTLGSERPGLVSAARLVNLNVENWKASKFPFLLLSPSSLLNIYHFSIFFVAASCHASISCNAYRKRQPAASC